MDEAEWNMAMLYILNNCDEADPYISLFESQLPTNISNNQLEFERINRLVPWFAHLVRNTDDLRKSQLSALFRGERKVKKFKGYVINGLKFHTESYGKRKKTMNSGICVSSITSAGQTSKYYGMLQEILEFAFYMPGLPEQRIHLFKCDWYDNRAVKTHKKYGLVELDPSARLRTNESFVLPDQVTQVYYARYASRRLPPRRKDIWAVCPIKPRHVIDVSAVSSTTTQDPVPQSEYYQEAEAPMLGNLVVDFSGLDMQVELVDHGATPVELPLDDNEEEDPSSEEDHVTSGEEDNLSSGEEDDVDD